jgi:hypothetical protein
MQSVLHWIPGITPQDPPHVARGWGRVLAVT